MNIAVIGAGCAGLVTGACLADAGHQVFCFDPDREVIRRLRENDLPFHEPDLSGLLGRNIGAQRLSFSDTLAETLPAAVVFLALPAAAGTDSAADAHYILDMAGQIGPLISNYTLIVIRARVPAGTADQVRTLLSGLADNALFDVACNPEFLPEGRAVASFLQPDRVIIGADNARAVQLLESLYRPFIRQSHLLRTSVCSAELSPYLDNAWRALQSSFMSEMAALCAKAGADADEVLHAIRSGSSFRADYNDGALSRDLRTLIQSARDLDLEPDMLEAALKVHDRQPLLLADRLRDYFGDLSGKVLAVWGAAGSGRNDSSGTTLIRELLLRGAVLQLFDPQAAEHAAGAIVDVVRAADPYEVLRGADALLVLSGNPVLRSPDFDRMAGLMRHPAIFDACSSYLPEVMDLQVFYYESAGRRIVHDRIRPDQPQPGPIVRSRGEID